MVGRPLTRKLAEKAIIENNDMEIAREELGKNIARWAAKSDRVDGTSSIL
jgi:hypothetical protein